MSIRLGESDVRNIKLMAQRLGVRDSDIIRYAIKTMLSRMSPLCDEAIRGRNLVPVLVESGDDLIRYFELDAYRLDGIINGRVDPSARVDRDDIALLAMSGLAGRQYRRHEDEGRQWNAARRSRQWGAPCVITFTTNTSIETKSCGAWTTCRTHRNPKFAWARGPRHELTFIRDRGEMI